MILLQVIFWVSLFLIFYSYLLFPLMLQWMARRKKISEDLLRPEEYPHLSVLISAFNEESVIEEKIRGLLDSDYPAERLEILVGSDASTDHTNQILKQLEEQHTGIHIQLFEQRKGKPGVINELAERSSGEILVITDANVMVDKHTLSQLARHFQSDQGK